MEIRSKVLMGIGAALEATTEAGQSAGGWVRLARMRNFSDRTTESDKQMTYVLAVRPVSTGREFQFGCSCPDWLHRKSKTGEHCKHQKAFLEQSVKRGPKGGLWLYRAGRFFLSAFTKG